MKHYTILTSYPGEPGVPRKERTKVYHLEISEGPAWKVIRGHIYHWYDMQKWMWPAQKVLGRIMEKLKHEPLLAKPDPEFSKSNNTNWEMRQDFRCYRWNKHEHVLRTEVDEATARKFYRGRL